MRKQEQSAVPFVPNERSLPSLRAAAAECRGCDLWRIGTQTVFGEGPARATMMLVGEQPGNEEDLSGEPFVGPAGKLRDRALAAARIDRRSVNVTNAVKHFKWEPQGKRRIHKKPSGREIRACRPWLDAELESVKPDVVVALGATAAQTLLGPRFRVTEQRGKLLKALGVRFVATVHPSSILRAKDDDSRKLEMQRFIEDLNVAASLLAGV
jgi:DNA polymerase